jgi:hypothetical protein
MHAQITSLKSSNRIIFWCKTLILLGGTPTKWNSAAINIKTLVACEAARGGRFVPHHRFLCRKGPSSPMCAAAKSRNPQKAQPAYISEQCGGSLPNIPLLVKDSVRTIGPIENGDFVVLFMELLDIPPRRRQKSLHPNRTLLTRVRSLLLCFSMKQTNKRTNWDQELVLMKIMRTSKSCSHFLNKEVLSIVQGCVRILRQDSSF